jgi:hypothetical protein
MGLCLAISCAEDQKIGQYPVDGLAPQPLKNVSATPTPGGAKITYEVPEETDISYVKGEFSFQGKKKVVRSSVYNDFLIVEGLGSVEPITIELSVVDHSQNASTPESVTFTPQTPPIKTIFTSMEMKPDFAGVKVTWDNPIGTEIGITLFAADSSGVMKMENITFSNLRDGSYTFRQYDAVERRFGISFSDKWGNLSDTVYSMITPLFETQLDRTKHLLEILPLDNLTTFSSSTMMDKMFDGLIPGNNNFYHTAEGVASIELPFYFSFTLGVTAQLSRFKMYHRFNSNWEYVLHNPKEFEVWGAETYRQGMPDEYWKETWKNDWKYIGNYITPKPSGIDNTTVTDEDKAFAKAGFEFYVPLEVGRVRYLRFGIKRTWGNTNASTIQELQFFGDDRN